MGTRGLLAGGEPVFGVAAVLGAEQVLLPALGVGVPTPRYGAKASAIDGLHHAVYVMATGVTYDLLRRR